MSSSDVEGSHSLSLVICGFSNISLMTRMFKALAEFYNEDKFRFEFKTFGEAIML
jgi:hypothetical protein